MSRYYFYVDGLNVYHSINNKFYCKYKWLNYWQLAKNILKKDDTLEGVSYFTTIARWKKDSAARHRQYIKVLRSTGVKDIQGRFMEKYIRCHICGKYYKTREEKQTDVNIAVHMISDGINDLYDRAVVVSGDTDLIPIIEMIHKEFPDKEIGAMFPIRRYHSSLEQVADFAITIKERHLRDSQFPEEVKVGDTIIKRPDSWC